MKKIIARVFPHSRALVEYMNQYSVSRDQVISVLDEGEQLCLIYEQVDTPSATRPV